MAKTTPLTPGDAMPDAPFCPKGTTILNEDGSLLGRTTGTFRRCQMAGCTGIKVGVRTPTKVVWRCSKALVETAQPGTLRIG